MVLTLIRALPGEPLACCHPGLANLRVSMSGWTPRVLYKACPPALARQDHTISRPRTLSPVLREGYRITFQRRNDSGSTLLVSFARPDRSRFDPPCDHARPTHRVHRIPPRRVVTTAKRPLFKRGGMDSLYGKSEFLKSGIFLSAQLDTVFARIACRANQVSRYSRSS